MTRRGLLTMLLASPLARLLPKAPSRGPWDIANVSEMVHLGSTETVGTYSIVGVDPPYMTATGTNYSTWNACR